MTPQRFDLEQRTLSFAQDIIQFCKALPPTMANIECGKQMIRSAGSVGANYIEANEALGKKDFLYHIRICRKEAKETLYWLRLVHSTNNTQLTNLKLTNEATALKKIFSAIILKTEGGSH